MSKRRGKNEGSIYRRDDGLWVGSIHLGYINGKRRRKVVYGKTRREVIAKLDQLKREHAIGVDLAAEQQRVEQFLQTWIDTVVRPFRAERTTESYRQIARLYLVPHIGHIALDKLSAHHVQAMINSLTERVSATTVRYVRTVLVIALNQAIQWGYISRNPASMVTVPPAQRYQASILTPEQARLLLDTVAGHRLEALYQVALGLGLRKKEIRDLTWSDIDFDTRKLHIRSGKTPNARRVLNLPDSLIIALREHWQRQVQERQVQGMTWSEHGLVFPSEVGTPLTESTIWRHLKRSLKAATLPNIRFHDLRHSAASFLIAQGEHPRVIMEIMGHSSITITMDIYGHIDEQVQRNALEGISDRLQSGYTEGKREAE